VKESIYDQILLDGFGYQMELPQIQVNTLHIFDAFLLPAFEADIETPLRGLPIVFSLHFVLKTLPVKALSKQGFQ